MQISRRTFVGTGVAAIGVLKAGVPAAEGQLVYRHNDWKFAEFDALLKEKTRIKQVYDVQPIDDGGFLASIKNSLNGLHFGFEIPPDQIKIVAALRHTATGANFDDAIWAKYSLGDFLKIKDPETGKPPAINPYWLQNTATSTDPESHDSIYQDTSIQRLQGRGVKFLCCHNATTALARTLVKHNSLKVAVPDLVQELQSHVLPGVLIVPAMVAAIALLQTEGHYSYISA